MRCEPSFPIGEEKRVLTSCKASYSDVRRSAFCRTHLSTRSSELMFEEPNPINKIAMSPEGLLWCATTGSAVRCYDVGGFQWMSNGNGGPVPPPSPRTPAKSASGKLFHAGPSPQLRQRQRASEFSQTHCNRIPSRRIIPLREVFLGCNQTRICM